MNALVQGYWPALVAVLASAALLALGLRRGLRAGDLRGAGRRTLETVGLTVALLAFDVVVGAALCVLLRGLGVFLSLYLNTDPVMLVFAVLQALVVQEWRRGARG